MSPAFLIGCAVVYLVLVTLFALAMRVLSDPPRNRLDEDDDYYVPPSKLKKK